MNHEFTILHLFCGIGGAALGFQQAKEDYRGINGQFKTLGGIDCDPAACIDFERLTGASAFCMDLLIFEAYRDNLPGIILLENVPRITSRGKKLLHTVKGLLHSYDYVFHEGFHDCVELGGLGQHRRRYLLIARQPQKIAVFVYQPPKQRVKSIGEIIGPLSPPDDPAMEPIHRLPRLTRMA